MRKNSIDTIFALSTFYGPSAIAIVRISGPDSISIVDNILRPPIMLAFYGCTK